MELVENIGGSPEVHVSNSSCLHLSLVYDSILN